MDIEDYSKKDQYIIAKNLVNSGKFSDYYFDNNMKTVKLQLKRLFNEYDTYDIDNERYISNTPLDIRWDAFNQCIWLNSYLTYESYEYLNSKKDLQCSHGDIIFNGSYLKPEYHNCNIYYYTFDEDDNGYHQTDYEYFDNPTKSQLPEIVLEFLTELNDLASTHESILCDSYSFDHKDLDSVIYWISQYEDNFGEKLDLNYYL